MKRLAVLFADYLYDMRRFARYSAFGKDATSQRKYLEARLMIAAHGLEKALSFQEFEPRRAKQKLTNTLRLRAKFAALDPYGDRTAFQMAEDAIANYRHVHAQAGVDISDLLHGAVSLPDTRTAEPSKSVRAFDSKPLTDTESVALLKGMSTRASVREFANRPVDPGIVARVVAASMATPSVCNRQGFRAHYALEREIIDAALTCQNGNSGFGERVPGLFVVTCSQTIFGSSSERNQAFVDGGMFSMSLLLALHAHGLGGCSLNWSASYRQDKALRKAISVPDDEVIIMMIAFGHLGEAPRAAASRRYDLARYLHPLKLSK